MRVSSRIKNAFNSGYCIVEDYTQLHPNGRDVTLDREDCHSASQCES
jgi:hypothetical protein